MIRALTGNGWKGVWNNWDGGPEELGGALLDAVSRHRGDLLAVANEVIHDAPGGWSNYLARERSTAGGPDYYTDAEIDLLIAFVERPQRTLSREQLLDLARGRQAQLFDRSIDVAVMRLRRKIEPDPAKPEIIRTVRNGGYLFAADVETRA